MISRRRLLLASTASAAGLSRAARAPAARHAAPAVPEGAVIRFEGDPITDAGRDRRRAAAGL